MLRLRPNVPCQAISYISGSKKTRNHHTMARQTATKRLQKNRSSSQSSQNFDEISVCFGMFWFFWRSLACCASANEASKSLTFASALNRWKSETHSVRAMAFDLSPCLQSIQIHQKTCTRNIQKSGSAWHTSDLNFY